jgi:hypothetical protein
LERGPASQKNKRNLIGVYRVTRFLDSEVPRRSAAVSRQNRSAFGVRVPTMSTTQDCPFPLAPPGSERAFGLSCPNPLLLFFYR